jgi:hypothetical protein
MSWSCEYLPNEPGATRSLFWSGIAQWVKHIRPERRSLEERRIFVYDLVRINAKSAWRSGFFIFCKRVFRAARRKSLQCNRISFAECARNSFSDAKVATLLRNSEDSAIRRAHFAVQDAKIETKIVEERGAS